MKKTTRNLLIMLAVLLVLGGGAAALLLLPQGGGETGEPVSSAVSQRETETVTDLDVAEVAAVAVKNRENSFTFIPQGDSFTLEGYEDSVVNTLTVENSVTALSSLTSTRSLGAPGELEPFGLAGENAVEAEIRLKDGSSQRLVLGIPAGETSGRYVLKDGTVYICPGVPENLYGSLYVYFTAALYTIETKETEDASAEDYDILYNLKLSGKNFPEPVEIVYDPSYLGMYLLKSPILAESGTTPFLNIKSALLAPTASAVAAVHLTPELLEEYGLAQPAAVAEFDLNNAQHKMQASAARDGKRYVILDDRDVIYEVADATVSPWADATLMQLRMSYIWLANISSVETLTVTENGEPAGEFHITRELNEEKSTETPPSYDLTVRDAAGNGVNYKDYQGFYSDLISIAVLNVDKAEISGEPAYKVVYQFFEGGDPDVVEFYAVGTDRYAAVLNGGFSGQVRKSETDAAFAKLDGLTGQ